LRRMRFADCDKSLGLPGARQDFSDTALLLRGDLAGYGGAILPMVKTALNDSQIEVVNYSFGAEIFSDEILARIGGKKNIAIAFLADDYNEEIFENIENLVNKFPEKFLSVHILGRLSKAQGAFRPPASTEKSWWARKINSISSRNIKLFDR
ncbi:MAG: hypothetical protein J6T16_05765, partial [Opitutales bacterium]|nr:hypothetical protein [Opitutales bacterium]